MAIVKIIAIRDRLDKRVNYAINGEKTTLDAGITCTKAPNAAALDGLYSTMYHRCIGLLRSGRDALLFRL